MLTFIQLLEDLADTGRSIRIPASDVDRLVDRFGGRVREMGRWNASSDGSVEIPVKIVREAAPLDHPLQGEVERHGKHKHRHGV